MSKASDDEALLATVRADLSTAHLAVRRKHQPKPNARERAPFVHVPVEELLAGATVLAGALELLVWIYILREWHMRRSMGVLGSLPVTNVGLARWGVSRFAKRRAIDKLSKAGLLHVEKHGGRNPRVSVAIRPRERGALSGERLSNMT